MKAQTNSQMKPAIYSRQIKVGSITPCAKCPWLLIILTLIVWHFASSAHGASVALSALPATNSAGANDSLIIVSTNASVNVDGRITIPNLAATASMQQAYKSNFTMTAVTGSPTNQYLGTGTLHLTNNGYTVTITGGDFATNNVFEGEWLAVPTNGGNPAWQGQVTAVVNSTNISVDFDFINQTSAPTVWYVYPGIATWKDNTPRICGGIDNGDGLYIYGDEHANSGALAFMNGPHSFRQAVRNQGEGWRLEFESAATHSGSPFSINESAPYDSIHVLADGTVSVRSGLTNASAASLAFLSPETHSSTEIHNAAVTNKAGSFNLAQTAIAQSATLAGAVSTNKLVASAASFTNYMVGWQILIGTQSYSIVNYINSTTVLVYPDLQNSYTTSAFTLTPTVEANITATPAVGSAFGPDGTLTFSSANDEGPFITWSDGTDIYGMGMANNGGADTRFAIFDANFDQIISINNPSPAGAARYDALRVLGDGTVSVRFALTNAATGTLAVGSPTNATPGTPGTVNRWMTLVVDGTTYYVPLYK